MKIKSILTVNALLSLAFGAALLVRPFELGAMFGVGAPAWGVTGLFGATLVGLSFLLWGLRHLDDAAQRVVARALAAMNGLVALVALAQQQALWNSTGGQITAAVYLSLAAAYLFCLMAGAKTAHPARRV